MKNYTYISLREKPELKNCAAEWFHSKWGVPTEAYLECMEAYLNKKTEYGWYICLDENKIVGGLGVIENDFHDRKDLTPNVCAVYTEEEYRCQGISGHLLNMVVEDLKSKNITPVYLITDHTSFYERYGWEFLCMVQGDGEPNMTRMYIHQQLSVYHTNAFVLQAVIYNFNVEKDAYLSEKLTIESKKLSFQNIKFAIESQNYNEPTKKHIKNI